MKTKRLKSFSIISLMVAVLMVTLSLTYSWLVQIDVIPNNVIGKTRSSYFGGGNGTSQTPYIISKPNHFFNLASLQNLGIFTTKTYFEVTADIDFNYAYPTHKIIEPIGTSQYPFIGEINGNYHKISYYTVDGYGQQDIGTFGVVGHGGVVEKLFLESPKIISYNNPTQTEINNFHEHDNVKTVAMGYIAGHVLGDEKQGEQIIHPRGIVRNVFVVTPDNPSAPKPTLQIIGNQTLNSSQSGLIGYSENFGSIIPDESYSFSLDGNTGKKLYQFISAYGSSYKILSQGSSTPQSSDPNLSSIIQIKSNGNPLVNIPTGRSLSQIKIYKTNPQGPVVYLVDEMKAAGYEIPDYRRENLDISGVMDFIGRLNKTVVVNFAARDNLPTVPTVGSTFNPASYTNSIILYVKSTRDATKLGKMIYGYDASNSKGIMYTLGWFTDGGVYGYQGGKTAQYEFINTPYDEFDMTAENAFTAIKVNKSTGIMTVVNPVNTIPDYYVFVIGTLKGSTSTGNQRITSLEFHYTATDFTNAADLDQVDFVINSEIQTVIQLVENENYQYSYYTFNYSIMSEHGLNISAYKKGINPVTGKNQYAFDFSYAFATSDPLSYFDMLISNRYAHDVTISNIINDNTYKTVTSNYSLISIRVQGNNVYVDGNPLS